MDRPTETLNLQPQYENRITSNYKQNDMTRFPALKSTIYLFLAFVLTPAILLAAEVSGPITYLDHGTYLEITDCEDSFSGEMVISDYVPGNVTRIGERTFDRCRRISKVILPLTVNEIGYEAFANCEIESINLPEGLEIIEAGAFKFCRNLNSVTIPSSLVILGAGAFERCESLSDLTIESGLKSIGAEAFSGSALVDLALPPSIEELGDSSFSYCDQLRTVSLPISLKDIPGGAFRHCSSLTSLSIPSSITSIGEDAFRYSGLVSVDLATSVANIGENAFSDLRNLLLISVDSANAYYTSQDGVLFDKAISRLIVYPAAKADIHYQVPDTITVIDPISFKDCHSLESIVFPTGLNTIGSAAFEWCSQLSEVELPSGLTSLGAAAFRNCSSLESATIPAGIEDIPYGTFRDCGLLSSIEIADGITSIGTYAFLNCSSLTNVEFPDTLTVIGERAFHYCSSIGQIAIPPSVETIENRAFEGCDSMTSLSLAEGLATLEGFAFQNCNSIVSIRIPSSVTTIGEGIFSSCDSLESVIVDSDNINYASKDGVLYDSSFSLLLHYPASKQGDFYNIPTTVIAIGEGAIQGNSYLRKVIVPENVSRIGSNGFRYCPILEEICFLGDAPLSVGFGLLFDAADTVDIYHFEDTLRFDYSRWTQFSLVEMGAHTPFKVWLIRNQLHYDSLPGEDQTDNEIPLLISFALNMDPNKLDAGKMPQAILSNGKMEYRFWSNNSDVSYVVSTSVGLNQWSTDEVSISQMDTGGYRVASVTMDESARFLRLEVAEK